MNPTDRDVRPCPGRGARRKVDSEVVPLTNERLLDEVVQKWADLMLPGEARAADIAAQIARERYSHGASVTEACRQARTFLGSWSRHPSRPTARIPKPRRRLELT